MKIFQHVNVAILIFIITCINMNLHIQLKTRNFYNNLQILLSIRQRTNYETKSKCMTWNLKKNNQQLVNEHMLHRSYVYNKSLCVKKNCFSMFTQCINNHYMYMYILTTSSGIHNSLQVYNVQLQVLQVYVVSKIFREPDVINYIWSFDTFYHDLG